MKSLNRFDVFFLSIMSVLLLLSLAAFAQDTLYARSTARERQVGTITFKNRVAEQKNRDTTRWVNLVNDGPVYNRDTIRTGSGSTATIHLDNSSEITLSEDSMIYIDLSSKNPRLTLAAGNLIIDNASATTPITLSTGSGDIDVAGGTLDVIIEGKDAIIRQAKGTSVITKDGSAKPIALDGAHSFSVASGAASADGFTLSEPESGARLFSTERARTVTFSWTAVRTDDTDPTLVIAADRTFKKKIVSIPSATSGESVSLVEGTYYWKLDDSGRFGWFTIKRVAIPHPIAPINASFIRGSKMVSVPFAWSRTDAEAYHAIVYKVGSPETPVINAKIALSRVSFDVSEPGEYAWKVSGIGARGEETNQDSLLESRFSIREGTLAAPDLLSGKTGGAQKITVSALAGIEGKPITRWLPVTGAKAYDVRVSATRDGSSPRYEGSTQVAAITPDKALEPGTYYVSAAAIGNGDRSQFSEPIELVIRPIQPLSSMKPPSGGKITPKNGMMTLSWTDDNGGSRYRIVCSRSTDLTDPIATIETRKTTADILVPDGYTGELFWKAELLDQSGRTVAETSILTAIVARVIASPEPVSPIGGIKLDLLAIESIHLEWKKSSEATEYLVRLFRMTGGIASPQGEWKTSDNFLTFKDLSRFALDGFAWELTAVRKDTATGESLYSEPVTSYFRIYQKERLSVPKIKTMKSLGEL